MRFVVTDWAKVDRKFLEPDLAAIQRFVNRPAFAAAVKVAAGVALSLLFGAALLWLFGVAS